MVALDTTVAIKLLRNEFVPPVGMRIDNFALLVIVIGELLFGARNFSRPEAILTYYRRFIYNLEPLLLNSMAAEYYAEIRMALKQKGRPIPENDG